MTGDWCPASHRVRTRRTELGVDCVFRQVTVEKNERVGLLEAAGTDTSPALARGDGPSNAAAHRIKAEKARRRYPEEECECPPATP